MSSFEEIINADGNADLVAALTGAEQDFADAEALRGDGTTVDVEAVDATDTIGSVAPDGTRIVLAYREEVGGNEAYIVVVINDEVAWMPVAYGSDIAEWLTSRVARADERGRA